MNWQPPQSGWVADAPQPPDSKAPRSIHLETDPTTGELVYVFRAIGTHDIYRNS